MTVFHRLVGYDKTTERVAVEYEVPPVRMDFAKRVAGVGPDDPDAVFCYELSPHQARDIAGTLGLDIDGNAYDYFLEGYSTPLTSAA